MTTFGTKAAVCKAGGVEKKSGKKSADASL
jgi:hypothetical protein